MTHPSPSEASAPDEALAWHASLAGDDADWLGFTRWLEADPSHRTEFDAVALTDRMLAEHRPALRQVLAVVPTRSGWITPPRKWAAASAAAVLAVVGLSASVFLKQPADSVYATGIGQSRQIALGDGIAIDLAPSSRLIAKGGDPERLELAQGEAFFKVDHDPDRALRIKAGSYSLTDIGTSFSVNTAPRAITVSVSEGRIAVVPAGGTSVNVNAGQQLVAMPDDGTIRLQPVGRDNVASWRQGRLVYDNTPLAIVASDISRYSGTLVVVEPGISARSFSGVLTIGDGSRLVATLSDLMAVPYVREGDRVRLGAGTAR